MEHTDDDAPKLSLVEDEDEDVEADYDDACEDYEYVFEQACKAQQEKNDTYLDEFEAYLTRAGLTDKTINRHLDNVAFYLNKFLIRHAAEDPVDVDAGCYYVDDFLGYYFIRKCMWSKPDTIKQNITSFKKFYACMLEEGHVSQKDYDELLATIRNKKDAWIEDCRNFNDPSYDYFNEGPRHDLFNAMYEELTKGGGLADLLGLSSMDDVQDVLDENLDDLPTRDEAVCMLTMALFYLTAWEEKGSGGMPVLRAQKSMGQHVVERLRDIGLIDCSDIADTVTITELGEQVSEEFLVGLGLDYLLDELS